MNADLRRMLSGLALACAALAAAGEAGAVEPRIAPRQAQAPVAPRAFGGFVNVMLPAADATRLRAAAPRGMLRMRAASSVADRLVTALDARAMRPVLQAEQIFPAAVDLGLDRWYTLEVDPAADIDALVARARAVAGVEYATPDRMPAELAVAPNDTLFSKNWGHGNTGTFPAWVLPAQTHTGSNVGTVGFDANVQGGWAAPSGYGSASTIIAILDTGVDPHADLREVQGWDYWSNDSIPNDPNGHGTSCAGVAAGIANNTLGVAGAAGGCSIMGIRFLPATADTFSQVAFVQGLAYAANHGAKVISMSIIQPAWTKLIADVVNAVDAAGVVMIAATGNANESAIYLPARLPKVIAVGAASPCASRKRSSKNASEVNPGFSTDSLGTSCDGETFWGSNWGVAIQDDSAAVDLLGPTELPTTVPGGGFTYYFNGTSCAAPYVAGVAALILSQHPTWTPAQVRQRLVETAIDISDAQTPAGWDKYTGYGMVNAGLPDMFPYTWPGWAKSIVPRATADGSFGSVPAPTTLTGDGTTYINAGAGNGGEARSGAEDWNIYLDGSVLKAFSFDLPVGVGTWVNNVATTVPGGRHVFGQIVDPDGSAPEVVENNNSDGHQWVWQPAALTQNAIATRATPPFIIGGIGSIPVGETYYANQDGLRASPPPGGTVGFWVVGAHATDSGDPDLYIYRPSSGATSGFVPSTSLAFSGAGGAVTDFAWWNMSNGTPQPATLDVGIAAGVFGSPAFVKVENRSSQVGVAFGGTTVSTPTQSLVQDQAIAAHYLDVQAGGAGPVTIELATSLTGGLGAGVHVALISPTDSTGSRVSALQYSSKVNNVERLSRTLAAGRYGIVVYRDQLWEGMGPGTYTLTIRRTPPELVAGGLGWYAPSVPFKSGVGNFNTAPTVLDGNVANTIFAYGYVNNGPTTASGFQANELLDGGLLLNWTPGAVGAGSGAGWLSAARNVPGGLHTMGFENDVTNAIDEFDETNNNHASQWVWSPLQLATGIPVTRPVPPDPHGGWSDIPGNVTHYDNVDGLRSPLFYAPSATVDGSWGAVALAPVDPAGNPNLRAYLALSTGPSNGFRSEDATSARSAGLTDFVLADATADSITFDVGLTRAAGTLPVKVHAVSSKYLAPSGLGSDSYGPFSLGPDSVIAVFQLGNANAATRRISLVNLSGNADLDFYLFGHGAANHLYTPGVATTTIAQQGAGLSEFYKGPVSAKPALVVIKAGYNDVGKAALFRLDIGDPTTDVPADVPASVAFAPVRPNPAHGDAALRFDLPHEANVELAVYDVGGRRLATLANGTWSAGRHSIEWSLLDDGGRRVASGVYLVRFRSGGYEMTQRVLVIG